MRHLLLSTICIAIVSGCTSRDVTAFPKYHVGYVPDHVYQLKTERELVRSDLSKRSSLHLVELGAAERADWLHLVGTLPAGTRIRVEQLKYDTSINLSDVNRYVIAYGRVLDGPHADAKVLMTGVSKRIDFPAATLRSRALAPDPQAIEEVHE